MRRAADSDARGQVDWPVWLARYGKGSRADARQAGRLGADGFQKAVVGHRHVDYLADMKLYAMDQRQEDNNFVFSVV
jgi:hypothetical protein